MGGDVEGKHKNNQDDMNGRGAKKKNQTKKKKKKVERMHSQIIGKKIFRASIKGLDEMN